VGGTAGTGGVAGSGGTAGQSGSAGVAGSGGFGGTSGAGGNAGCPVGKGPAMKRIPSPAPGPSYCIDTTEVTNAQYKVFLASIADAGAPSQPVCCSSWNTTFVPSQGWPATGKDGYPVAYVDWCDALAFCKWAGKRLCGGIGATVPSYSNNDYKDATKDQWYNACSSGAVYKYTWGNAPDPAPFPCNGAQYLANETVSTGSLGSCQSPLPNYSGIFDLSGNVAEWEDLCSECTSPGNTTNCNLRGGDFDTVSALACDFGGGHSRDFKDDVIGFRCCAD
jgi:formylglycine-generating enzyme required for sulfatase activity